MNYRKSLFLAFLLGFLGIAPLFAQSNTVPAGGDATGSNGSVSYTVGQIDYIYETGSGGSANQGLQQPFEIFVILSVEDVEDIQIVAKVFPNPTISNVTLFIGNRSTDDLSFHLFDLSGRLLMERKLESTETLIPMDGLAAATYFLSVSDGATLLKTFKIIKN